MQATKLFYCYAHEDKALQDQLVKQLAPLERLGLIAGWSDRDISAGQHWQNEIDKRLNTADIILLLISPDFIASDYCHSVEVKRAMERHEAGEARVIPIILRPVYWQAMPFGQLQALPTHGKPIDTWRNRNEAFLKVVQGLRKVIEELPPISDVCPYRGLAAFIEQDYKLFFGRERAVETVLKRLKNSPHFLALVGPSGSGKSSLVQAGVMRQLRQGTWLGTGKRLEKIISRPGSNPFAELTLQGLPGTSTSLTERVQAWLEQHPEKERLILIIDQFEEIWTLCSPQMAQDFTRELVALIHDPVSVTLILIMRDDFDHRLAKHDALVDRVDASRVRVPSTLRQSELKAIMEGPARKERLHFTKGLVETIIEDILVASSTEVDGEIVTDNTILPLLEFALTRLWEERQDREMTREAYNSIGRVSGGLTVWADKAFRDLDTRLQPLTHAIFTKLVHLGDESQNIAHSRRRRTLSELYPKQKDSHAVIARLAKERLLVTSRDPISGEESVEIIHDVLLREWQQLRDWIAKDRSFLLWYQQLERRLQLWVETNPYDFLLRDEGRLLGGRDLEDAEHWVVERPLDFNPEQQDFIMFSRKAAERQQQALIARQLATQAEVLQNQKTHYLQRSMLLAVEAMLHFPCLEADQALRSRLAMFPRPVALLQHSLKDVRAVAFSQDGRYLATAGRDHTARVWEVSTGREITRIHHGRELYSGGPIFGEVKAVAFSPDGRYVASAGDDQMAYVHEALSGKRVASMAHEGGYVGAVIFSPDGSYLATASGDRTARVWKATSGEEVVRLTHNGIVKAVAFSPDGRYLATASDDGTAQVWDTSCREIIAHIAVGETVNDPEKQALNAVAFSQDGRYLAVGGRKKILDGIIVIWDTSSHSEVRRIEFGGTYGVSLPNATVNAIMFSPDGHSLVTANEDWTARLWDVATGRQLQQFAHEGFYLSRNDVYALAFSPDGRYLATASGDGTAGVWETHSGRQIACLTGGLSLQAIAFSPDGRYLATAGYDQAARLWKIPDKTSLFCLPHFGPVYALTVSPDGRFIATGSQDRTAMVFVSINDQEKGEKTTIKGQMKAYVFHERLIRAIADTIPHVV
jgi:WD40 repeat protein/energy-coupling factor transporter ATP-binding protein EcfA2